uniref:ATP synthase subunit b, chloroplastic n=1 Tax=Biddulphia biddulphiana TaxID=1158022 RepID=A0A2U9NT24_9STRA|nr:ATP synthase CF0 subunit I [Biddulphia biddulphiana]AWT40036.1 ATP synthase CF0 subunit I [Biddulphia biddulphiana]
MKNFDQIFTLSAKSEGIGLNPDILETGVINIIALIIILVITGRPFLGSILSERELFIRQSISDAENRFNEANQRLLEAQKQLAQIAVVIGEIQNETEKAKYMLLQSNGYEAKKELKIRFDRALATFLTKERQVFIEVKEKIIQLVLQQTLIRAQQTFESKERAEGLINETINKLEGDLL